MERYINSFATENDIQIALENGELLKPYVAYIEDVDRIDWNSKEKVDYTTEYLTFNILSAGTINWTASHMLMQKTIEYKLNDGEWTSVTSTYEGVKITVNSGDKLQFRGNNAQYGMPSSIAGKLQNSSFGGSASFEAEGNIMSLINSTDFATLTTLESAYTFSALFNNCTGLTSAENLVLPATTLSNRCYNSMFQDCTSLTKAPKLPATILMPNCYANMFKGCTSLTTAPELPATTLADGCYGSMFNGCTSLTTAPALPATTLVDGCYSSMFNGCTSLTTAPALPVTTLTNSCYSYMFQNCASLTTAPALPATTLTTQCYLNMFNGCKKLNYIKCLATDISATNCTSSWVSYVASTGTFVKAASMTSWPTGDNGIPTGWTVQDA